MCHHIGDQLMKKNVLKSWIKILKDLLQDFKSYRIPNTCAAIRFQDMVGFDGYNQRLPNS
jgi:hypothetical protein